MCLQDSFGNNKRRQRTNLNYNLTHKTGLLALKFSFLQQNRLIQSETVF